MNDKKILIAVNVIIAVYTAGQGLNSNTNSQQSLSDILHTTYQGEFKMASNDNNQINAAREQVSSCIYKIISRLLVTIPRYVKLDIAFLWGVFTVKYS